MATRKEVLDDIEQTLGFVPGWLDGLPDNTIEAEWSLMKEWDIGETTIPNKYKQLIGIAVAANMQCDYCVAFHTEFARLFGATEEEIAEAIQMAKQTTGWSIYFKGTQVDPGQFKHEVREICDTIAAKEKAA